MKLTELEKAQAQQIAMMLVSIAGNGLKASKKFGIKEPTLWHWRNGRKSPTRKNFEKLKQIMEKK